MQQLKYKHNERADGLNRVLDATKENCESATGRKM